MNQTSVCLRSATGIADESDGVSIQVIESRAIAALSAFNGQCELLADRIYSLFGIKLPKGAYRSTSGSVAAIGRAPQAWLLVDELGGSALVGLLLSALQGIASVCDQSDAYQIVKLQGAKARDVLMRMFQLDFHPAVFGEGAVAVTRAGHFSVTLYRLADSPDGRSRFEIMVSRSVSESFRSWLADSSAPFGLLAEEHASPSSVSEGQRSIGFTR